MLSRSSSTFPSVGLPKTSPVQLARNGHRSAFRVIASSSGMTAPASTNGNGHVAPVPLPTAPVVAPAPAPAPVPGVLPPGRASIKLVTRQNIPGAPFGLHSCMPSVTPTCSCCVPECGDTGSCQGCHACLEDPGKLSDCAGTTVPLLRDCLPGSFRRANRGLWCSTSCTIEAR
jgi:hypothetical protein